MPAAFTREEIFAPLDAALEDASFPNIGHPYSYPIDSRLHVFRDDSRWALLVEVVGYNPRSGGVVDIVHHFGKCLDGPSGFDNDDFLFRISDQQLPLDDETGMVLTAAVPQLVVEGRGAVDVPDQSTTDCPGDVP